MLEEHRGTLGLVLWQSLRDVTLWASFGPGDREGIFAPAAGSARRDLLRRMESVVGIPLATLAAMVEDPEAARAEVISRVCRDISRWAEERGMPETALAYAQAAALVFPGDPAAALAVGTMALRQKKEMRAETWLRRTVGLARRAGEWAVYSEAFMALGTMYEHRGERTWARRFLLRALRAGRRHALAEVRGRALHALFLLALRSGRLEEAEHFARAAVHAHGRGHPRLLRLLHDVTSLWVDRESHARALPMLRQLLPLQMATAERTVTLALLARASAGAGDAPAAREAWNAAWDGSLAMGDHPYVPTVLADLARAAATVHDWNGLEQAVRRASRVAARHGEMHLPADVEWLARTVHERPR